MTTKNPSRTAIKHTAALLAAAFATAAVSPVATAADAKGSRIYCTRYAETAVHQFDDYRSKGGTRENTVWHGSYGRHMNYCLNVPMSQTGWLETLRWQTLDSGNF